MLKIVQIGIVAALVAVSAGRAGAQAPAKDIVDTAIAAGSFTTLAKALQAADLVDTLKGKGPFTVFAPTDEAFAKLPAGTLDELIKPENKEKLQRLLTYHVVGGRVGSAQMVKMTTAKAVSGDAIHIKTSGTTLMVDNATVVKSDVPASNGVIHVIDAVIMPDSVK